MAGTDPRFVDNGQIALFIQEDGPSPANGYYYAGTSALDALSASLGDINPRYLPNPAIRNNWIIVGSTPSQPGLPTTSVTTHANKSLSDLWWTLKERGCTVNMLAVIDNCARRDNPHSWESLILMRRSQLTSFSPGPMAPLDGGSNATWDITGDITMQGFDRILPLQFEEQADAAVLAEVLDGFFNDAINCGGQCGNPSDGCEKFYALAIANPSSAGLSSQVIYTTDLGSYSALDIPTLGGGSGTKCAPMGSYMVVIAEADEANHVIKFTTLENGDTTGWARVTGYTSGKGPRCIYVKDSLTAFIGGAGGYIYKLNNPTAAPTVLSDGSVSTQDINDIRGLGDVVIAVGDSNAVWYSANNGATFVAVTGPTVGIDLNTCEIINDRIWFVGTDNGKLYYTTNAGSSWTLHTLDSSVTHVDCIRFYDENVGYMSVRAGASARVYRTVWCGNFWSYEAPYISALPTSAKIDFVTPCGYNRVAAGGYQTAGGDGMLAIAG